MKNIIIALFILFGLCVTSNAQINSISPSSQYQYKYISSSGTTVIKSSSGVLHNIVVNGGSAGTLEIFDNTIGSGPIISNFDSTNSIAAYPYDIVFSSGCTVVTGANTKITVSYL